MQIEAGACPEVVVSMAPCVPEVKIEISDPVLPQDPYGVRWALSVNESAPRAPKSHCAGQTWGITGAYSGSPLPGAVSSSWPTLSFWKGRSE